jgi:hypothetical protein
MKMRRETRRSGLSLVLAGLAGIGCFFATDPRSGVFDKPAPSQVVQAINEVAPGTYVGSAGCATIALIGLWLMTRRTA